MTKQEINLSLAARIFQHLCTLQFDQEAKPTRCEISKESREKRKKNFDDYNRVIHKPQNLTVWRNVSNL